jgi:hypothetical protein
MEKLTKNAIRLIVNHKFDGVLPTLAEKLCIAFAQNSGLAGLLPEAIAELSIDTAVSLFNRMAEFGKEQ